MSTRKVFGIAGSLALAACGSSTPTAQAPAAPVAAKAKAAPASVDAGVSAARAEAALTYSYNPIGKRDPFRGLIVFDPLRVADGGVSLDVCQEPLCKYDLQDLSLVAVISGDANPMAMVEDSQHIGYLVRKNTKIGKNNGKVTSILSSCLQVTNYVTSAEGKSLPNRVDLCVKVDPKMRDPQDLFKNKVD